MKETRHTTNVSARNATNQSPIEDWAKACTELTTPLRVRNVPKIDSRNVAKMSHMFHTFNIPRFSCIITECRKAVPSTKASARHFQQDPSPSSRPSPARNTPNARREKPSRLEISKSPWSKGG